MYARVSKKGQVTIPKAIREVLKLEKQGGVLFFVENDEVKLKGVPGSSARDFAGSLKKYADGYVPLETVRKKINAEIADETAREGLSD